MLAQHPLRQPLLPRRFARTSRTSPRPEVTNSCRSLSSWPAEIPGTRDCTATACSPSRTTRFTKCCRSVGAVCVESYGAALYVGARGALRARDAEQVPLDDRLARLEGRDGSLGGPATMSSRQPYGCLAAIELRRSERRVRSTLELPRRAVTSPRFLPPAWSAL
jgi:hypothetical protein